MGLRGEQAEKERLGDGGDPVEVCRVDVAAVAVVEGEDGASRRSREERLRDEPRRTEENRAFVTDRGGTPDRSGGPIRPGL